MGAATPPIPDSQRPLCLAKRWRVAERRAEAEKPYRVGSQNFTEAKRPQAGALHPGIFIAKLMPSFTGHDARRVAECCAEGFPPGVVAQIKPCVASHGKRRAEPDHQEKFGTQRCSGGWASSAGACQRPRWPQ
mmetsp:Transcript_105746/g.264763  ORF Transcript_105746/g.264763 Transcript_105746/m.264763 type:complete len:133 (+) Transcript_105746:191-589(+)